MTAGPERLLRPKQVCEILSVSRAKLYLMMKEGEFPRPLKRGSISYWPESDVNSWVNKTVVAAKFKQAEVRKQ